jgi:hypothetical protein
MAELDTLKVRGMGDVLGSRMGMFLILKFTFSDFFSYQSNSSDLLLTCWQICSSIEPLE